MKNICVFCGSSSGRSPIYVEQAGLLGESLAKKSIGLVYGGASIGVMGATANACLAAGGEVRGVIPQSIIDLEVGHQNLTELRVVESMHERKAQMYEMSDAFFALPGGMGTLDELCEIVTWSQLKYHVKPCYLINTNGFFDGLIQHFNHICDEGFLSKDHLKIVKVYSNFEDAISDFLVTDKNS